MPPKNIMQTLRACIAKSLRDGKTQEKAAEEALFFLDMAMDLVGLSAVEHWVDMLIKPLIEAEVPKLAAELATSLDPAGQG